MQLTGICVNSIKKVHQLKGVLYEIDFGVGLINRLIGAVGARWQMYKILNTL